MIEWIQSDFRVFSLENKKFIKRIADARVNLIYDLYISSR